MKIYQGYVDVDGDAHISVIDGENKRPLKHIVRHSPTGFSWGYLGSGPADTALSILTDCLGEETANSLYMRFKSEHVATWPYKPGICFEVAEEHIKFWADIQSDESLSGICGCWVKL